MKLGTLEVRPGPRSSDSGRYRFSAQASASLHFDETARISTFTGEGLNMRNLPVSQYSV